MTKRIYFVRHGETQGNLIHTDYGSEEETLTESGRMQAAKVAERAQNIDFEVLITSSFRRALETTEVIKLATKCNVEVSDLFKEYEIPVLLRGLPFSDPAIQEYVRMRQENFDNPDWHQDNCENMFELKERVKSAVKYLEEREEDSIMVVSHAFFLQFFTAFQFFGEELNAERWDRAKQLLFATNTGITVFLIIEGKWKLLTWNDHAHFAE